jgi:glycosyltransferase involved in cell wall biosynthesis
LCLPKFFDQRNPIIAYLTNLTIIGEMFQISGLVITYNEEKNIAKCIESLSLVCDEIIIIDSYSKDKTKEIALSLGAKVVEQTFLGDGQQRIFGLQYCKNDWILNLDADERLDLDSYEFIKSQQYLSLPYDAYNFRRKNHLKDQRIDFAGWYPSYTCRFFNQKTAQPATAKVHQSVVAQNMKRTNLHLIHYGWDSFHQIISKYNQYTNWQAEEYLEQNKYIFALSPVIHGIYSFFRCYFLKSGIFNGVDGLTFSLMQAFFSYMKYAKYLKLKKEQPKTDAYSNTELNGKLQFPNLFPRRKVLKPNI